MCNIAHPQNRTCNVSLLSVMSSLSGQIPLSYSITPAEYNIPFTLKSKLCLDSKFSKSLNLLHSFLILALTLLIASLLSSLGLQDDKSSLHFQEICHPVLFLYTPLLCLFRSLCQSNTSVLVVCICSSYVYHFF